MKENFLTRVFSIRNLFIWGNIILFISFLAVLAKDHFREWKTYQSEYQKLELESLNKELLAIQDQTEKERLKIRMRKIKSRRAKIIQIMTPELGNVDRCITCHVGYDTGINPIQVNDFTEHPYAAPKNEIHKSHPFEKYGCVVCHQGQGLATVSQAGHGDVKHWDKPLLRNQYIQASCAKCHANVQGLKVEGKIYASEIIRAEKLILENGCLGCHQIRGKGGPIAPDWAEETADKPLTRIDFSGTGLPKEERTLVNWVKLHLLKDPQELVPGDPTAHFNDEPIAPSGMPYYAEKWRESGLSEKEIERNVLNIKSQTSANFKQNTNHKQQETHCHNVA